MDFKYREIVHRLYYYHKVRGLIDIRDLKEDEKISTDLNVVRVDYELFNVDNVTKFFDDHHNINGTVFVLSDYDPIDLGMDVIELMKDLTDVEPIDVTDEDMRSFETAKMFLNPTEEDE